MDLEPHRREGIREHALSSCRPLETGFLGGMPVSRANQGNVPGALPKLRTRGLLVPSGLTKVLGAYGHGHAGWTWGLEGGSGQWSSNPALFPWHTGHVLWDRPAGPVPGRATSPAPGGHWERCREACGQLQAPWSTPLRNKRDMFTSSRGFFQNRGASASIYLRSVGPECQPRRHRDGEAWAGVWAGWPWPLAPVSRLTRPSLAPTGLRPL